MSSLLKKTTILVIITVLSKVLGFAREIVLTYTYGAGLVSDVYIVSIGIPTILFATVNNSLATTFIPLYYRIKDESNIDESIKFVNNVLNIVILISFIMILVGLIFTEPLVKLFAMDFAGEKLDLAIKFTRVMIFGVLFIGISNIMSSWLHINNEFTIPGMIGFPSNIIIIASIIISGFTTPNVMVFGTLLAMLSTLIFQLPFAKKNGYKYQLYINIFDKNIKKMLVLIIPVFIGAITSQLNSIIDRSLASTLEDGLITILNSASRINFFFTSILIGTISSIIYPILSKLSNYKNKDEFHKLVFKSLNIVIVIIVPISVITVVFSESIIRVVYERGEFTAIDTRMTASALSCYAIGMIGISLRDLLNKIFYSTEDTKIPMINGSISILLNIILNIILIDIFGYIGLAMATTISSLVCILLLLRSLDKKIGYFKQDIIKRNILKSILASFMMALLAINLYKFIIRLLGFSFINELFTLFISIITGLIFYVIIIFLLKIEGIDFLLKYTKNNK